MAARSGGAQCEVATLVEHTGIDDDEELLRHAQIRTWGVGNYPNAKSIECGAAALGAGETKAMKRSERLSSSGCC